MVEQVPQEVQAIQQEELAQEPITSQRTMLARDNTQPASSDIIKAHVTLLEHRVLLSTQGDHFRLVQHHYHRLQSWHDRHTGWRIQRSSTVMRLIRTLSTTTPGYLYERIKEPRDFACLTWILWYAEQRQLSGRGNDQQFLLSHLAEQIQEQSAQEAEGNEPFDFRRPGDRYSIQRALNYLEGLGGLQLVDGQTREWVEQSPDADVLYEFTDIARSLVSSLDARRVTQVAQRLNDPHTSIQPTYIAENDTTQPLARAWRVLLLGPAFCKFDDPVAFHALQQQSSQIAEELLNTFGWLLDLQRDYACIVRPAGSSSGPVNLLTPYGSNDQIALLLCNALREQVRSGTWNTPDSYGCVVVATEDMVQLFDAVRERYGENWGNEARHKSAQSLLNDVYRKMRQLGVMRGPDASGHLLILPTAARFKASYDKFEEQEKSNPRTRNKANTKRKKDQAPQAH
ncbi:TIGR02678 family protein [Dictyobacter arantiisoli]|uniref:TIGR02678 family protein n=1 Tax=Dictyobacter arantiisoli TaxID=2014874 RepID=A0A5A5TEJ3_9CHLR|nr:TIGR02678 family protein [Dictyobacter arantiisoli]GCF09566.1 hypothetical protein KDI_31300 [Dictyobacter arantiisoli]